MHQLACTLLTVIFATLLNLPITGQENWPEFRGPTGDGNAKGSKLPIQFSEEKNVAWKTAIHGKGWSSPVVWGNQIWLTTATVDGKKMSAICVNLENGKIIHDILLHENSDPAFCHPTNSYASPTPVVEKGRVYVHFGSYGTTCLDSKTGKTIWQRKDLECDHYRGPASSPILFDNKLLVAFDGFDKQYVVALNKKDGKTVWKTDRKIEYGTLNGDWMKAYSTGAVFKVGKQNLFVSPSASATIAYEVKTGKPVWTAYHGGMNASARPIRTESGLVLISNGMGKMIAVDPKGQGDISKSNIAWSIAKGVAKKPSPIVVKNRMFMVNDRGIASCVNLKDGETIWQERLGGAFAASPIYDGEKILALSEAGDLYTFLAADHYELLGHSKLGDGFKASPAVVGDCLILRSFSHLYCIRNLKK